MNIADISGVLSSITTAMDIIKTITNLRDLHLIQDKVIDLNNIIISVQESAKAANDERASLMERIRDLERQISDKEKWDAEKDKYELVSWKNGIYAYVIKGTKEPEMAPAFCSACFDLGSKAVLQSTKIYMANVIKCSRCGIDNYST
ncbi:MAG: hypothetical protein ACHP65_09490 [Legionellales bacterium]